VISNYIGRVKAHVWYCIWLYILFSNSCTISVCLMVDLFVCVLLNEWLLLLFWPMKFLIWYPEKTKAKFSVHTGEKPLHDFWVAHSGFCFYVLSTVAIVCYVCDRGDWNFTLHFCRVVSNISVDFIYLRIIWPVHLNQLEPLFIFFGVVFLLYALNVFKWFP